MSLAPTDTGDGWLGLGEESEPTLAEVKAAEVSDLLMYLQDASGDLSLAAQCALTIGAVRDLAAIQRCLAAVAIIQTEVMRQTSKETG